MQKEAASDKDSFFDLIESDNDEIRGVNDKRGNMTFEEYKRKIDNKEAQEKSATQGKGRKKDIHHPKTLLQFGAELVRYRVAKRDWQKFNYPVNKTSDLRKLLTSVFSAIFGATLTFVHSKSQSTEHLSISLSTPLSTKPTELCKVTWPSQVQLFEEYALIAFMRKLGDEMAEKVIKDQPENVRSGFIEWTRTIEIEDAAKGTFKGKNTPTKNSQPANKSYKLEEGADQIRPEHDTSSEPIKNSGRGSKKHVQHGEKVSKETSLPRPENLKPTRNPSKDGSYPPKQTSKAQIHDESQAALSQGEEEIDNSNKSSEVKFNQEAVNLQNEIKEPTKKGRKKKNKKKRAANEEDQNMQAHDSTSNSQFLANSTQMEDYAKVSRGALAVSRAMDESEEPSSRPISKSAAHIEHSEEDVSQEIHTVRVIEVKQSIKQDKEAGVPHDFNKKKPQNTDKNKKKEKESGRLLVDTRNGEDEEMPAQQLIKRPPEPLEQASEYKIKKKITIQKDNDELEPKTQLGRKQGSQSYNERYPKDKGYSSIQNETEDTSGIAYFAASPARQKAVTIDEEIENANDLTDGYEESQHNQSLAEQGYRNYNHSAHDNRPKQSNSQSNTKNQNYTPHKHNTQQYSNKPEASKTQPNQHYNGSNSKHQSKPNYTSEHDNSSQKYRPNNGYQAQHQNDRRDKMSDNPYEQTRGETVSGEKRPSKYHGNDSGSQNNAKQSSASNWRENGSGSHSNQKNQQDRNYQNKGNGGYSDGQGNSRPNIAASSREIQPANFGKQSSHKGSQRELNLRSFQSSGGRGDYWREGGEESGGVKENTKCREGAREEVGGLCRGGYGQNDRGRGRFRGGGYGESGERKRWEQGSEVSDRNGKGAGGYDQRPVNGGSNEQSSPQNGSTQNQNLQKRGYANKFRENSGNKDEQRRPDNYGHQNQSNYRGGNQSRGRDFDKGRGGGSYNSNNNKFNSRSSDFNRDQGNNNYRDYSQNPRGRGSYHQFRAGRGQDSGNNFASSSSNYRPNRGGQSTAPGGFKSDDYFRKFEDLSKHKPAEQTAREEQSSGYGRGGRGGKSNNYAGGQSYRQ